LHCIFILPVLSSKRQLTHFIVYEGAFMGYAIYVPQGRAARLNKDALAYGIDALYTDGFSSCVIIAFIGKDNGKLSLMHFDSISDYEVIKDEVKRVEDSCEVVLIFRSTTNPLVKNILEYCQKSIPNQKISLKSLDDKHDGILLSLNKQKSDSGLHPQIKKYPMNEQPQYLLHHPMEEKLIAVQKIDQIIGVADAHFTQAFTKKCPYVFEKYFWTRICEWETKVPVDDKHPRNKEYMTSLEKNKNEPFITISRILGGIIENIKDITGLELQDDMKRTSIQVGFYLEGYLNNYDHIKPFKRNMKDALSQYKPKTSEDKMYMDKLLSVLDSPDDCFDKVKQIIADYEKASDSDTKKDILSEHKTFVKHYNDRKRYKNLAQGNEKMLTDAKSYSEKAVQEFQIKKYDSAFNLFSEALGRLVQVCMEDDKCLITAYYNLGRTLYKLNEHNGDITQLNSAKIMLETALTLRTSHHKDDIHSIEKNTNALKECREAIALLSSNEEKPLPVPK
jgi:hypothetical protein